MNRILDLQRAGNGNAILDAQNSTGEVAITGIVNDRDVLLQATVPRYSTGGGPSNGLNSMSVLVYKRGATSAAPARPSASSSYVFASGALVGLNNGWSLEVPSSGGGYLFACRALAVSTDPSVTIPAGLWSAPSLISVDGKAGTPGDRNATARLYQWAPIMPDSPAGISYFNWQTYANEGYTGSDGWSTQVPANPNFSGWHLYEATIPVSASAATTSSQVNYTGANIAALTINGADGQPGLKALAVSAYRWGNGPAPTAAGTATFTWATASYDTPPSGWSIVKPSAPGKGYQLFEATVYLVDAAGVPTTPIDWTTANVVGIGYLGIDGTGGAGSAGASSMIAYTIVDGFSLDSSPDTITVSGNGRPAIGAWGSTRAWTAVPGIPTAGQSLQQSNGTYDGVSVVWGLPYMSTFRVGQLSAISSNLGAITAGSIDIGTGTNSWHVDANGNSWAGSGTFAAAPYRVDKSGNARMRSVSVEDSAGNVILSTGRPLAAQVQANINLVPRIGDWPASSRYGLPPAWCYYDTSLAGGVNGYAINGQHIVLPRNSGYCGYESAPLGIAAQQWYTVSFVAVADSPTGGLTVDTYYDGNTDSTGLVVVVPQTPTRYTFTERMANHPSAPLARMRVYAANPDSQVLVWDVKIEIGQKATAWTDDIVTPGNAPERVLPNSISNTQIGGDIFSTNWNGGTDQNGQGWLLQRSGNLYCNNIRARGYVAGGAFTGYAWPASGSGFYAGPEGALWGNPNTGGYFNITSGGDVYAPGFSIVNGAPTFSGLLSGASGSFSGTLTAAQVVTTSNLVDHAVSSLDVVSGSGGNFVCAYNSTVQVAVRQAALDENGVAAVGWMVQRYQNNVGWSDIGGGQGDNTIVLSLDANTSDYPLYRIIKTASNNITAYITKFAK